MIRTGTLTYKNIEFTFVLEKDELHLIPPTDKRKTIRCEWIMKETAQPGVYASADPISVEERQLVGKCNETGNKIIFIPKVGEWLSFHNTKVIMELAAYVEFSVDVEKVNRAKFYCPEINHIYKVNQGVKYNFGSEVNNGLIGIETPDFEATASDKQEFDAFGEQVSMHYDVSRVINFGVTEHPISLTSSLIFDFDETNDFSFIYDLFILARNYLRFLCYRQNIYIQKILLSAPYKDNKHIGAATMYILHQDGETEEDPLKKNCYIKQDYLKGVEGKILTDIADVVLYMRHWPESYEDGKHITEARFVMITAAFEWEFRRLFPEGIKKSKETIDAESEALETLEQLKASSRGKLNSIYKRLIRNIPNGSMQPKISYVGKELSEIITPFGENLYRLNGEILDYNEMGKRLSKQRNDFAHGNLDKEFNGNALLDLLFMERIIYAMQLKYYGVENTNIIKAINDLFSCSLKI